MSRPDRVPGDRPADHEAAPFYRVMIGCGIAGVLIAIGAAVVDFGTGRHSDEDVPDAPRLPAVSTTWTPPVPLGGGPIVVDPTP
jgi:hypothetical protein